MSSQNNSAQISLEFPDGSSRQYDAGVTGFQVAEGISKSLAKRSVAFALDGELCDLADEIHNDGKIELVARSDEKALELIRHDCAHVLAEAVQDLWPDTQVTIWPRNRKRFLLRICPGNSIHPGRSAGNRKKDAPDNCA